MMPYRNDARQSLDFGRLGSPVAATCHPLSRIAAIITLWERNRQPQVWLNPTDMTSAKQFET
ncbi:protein of unknown function [Rhodovastum atsumiense]|nr:protein of unknown function [Rhodovastum atsumiense]